MFDGFDPSRTAELDMSEYRDLIMLSKRELAHQRAMAHIRPTQPKHSDPDWASF